MYQSVCAACVEVGLVGHTLDSVPAPRHPVMMKMTDCMCVCLCVCLRGEGSNTGQTPQPPG